MNVTPIQISDYEAFVFDAFLDRSEIERFSTLLRSLSYSMNASSSTETKAYNEVMAEIDASDFTASFLWKRMQDAMYLAGFEEITSKDCLEVLVNCNRFGGYSFQHVDNLLKNSWTVVYYANANWEMNWGGETLLCNEEGEPVFGVGFLPGRFLCFPSCKLHIAGTTSRECADFRFTLSVRLLAQRDKKNSHLAITMPNKVVDSTRYRA